MLRAARTAAKTDTGRQRRDNEDSAFARAPLFVIADGMGGAQAGEVASQAAVEAFSNELSPDGSPEERLAGRARDANRKIYEMAQATHELAGMGTTLTAVYVDDADLAVAHVGDSRAYLFREGELVRLTQDHTLVDELVRRGKLTEEEAAEHPQRSIITRALGVDPQVQVDTRTYAGRAGDIVLMCSDGLTSMISEDEIIRILSTHPDTDQAAEALIAAANEAGGRDNITVILFMLEEVGGSAGIEHDTEVGMTPVTPPTTGSVSGDSADSARASGEEARSRIATLTAAGPGVVPAPDTASRRPVPLARTQGRRGKGQRRRRSPRFARPVAALVTVVVVLGLVGAGGYLATRQLFFIGTNQQGIVTIYRGLPYDLPLGVHLYETFYVSGVPVATVPTARRGALLNHQLRSQSDAISLVHAAELGQLVR